jgi:kumamolisin
VDNGSQPNGGTSAATPLIASLLTLINAGRGPGKRVDYLTPILYQSVDGTAGAQTVGSIGCTDILSGNNATAHVGGYSAGPGYDAAAGWGTPNGVKLANILATVLP